MLYNILDDPYYESLPWFMITKMYFKLKWLNFKKIQAKNFVCFPARSQQSAYHLNHWIHASPHSLQRKVYLSMNLSYFCGICFLLCKSALLCSTWSLPQIYDYYYYVDMIANLLCYLVSHSQALLFRHRALKRLFGCACQEYQYCFS